MEVRIDRRDALKTAAGLAAGFGMSRSVSAEEAKPAVPQCSAGHLAPDFTIIYRNDDPKLYVEGCGLVRLGKESFLAVVPIVPRSEYTKEMRVAHSHTHLLRSDDGGKSWQELAVLPYYSARPWLHGGSLYLFAFEPGPKRRNDDVVLLKSEDGGKTWSQPVQLFDGHFWNCQTGMVERDGKVYWVFDDISGGNGPERVHRVIAGDLSANLMDPKSWRISNGVPFSGIPPLLSNPAYANLDDRHLEPNLIDLRGKLRVISSMKPDRQATANLVALFDVEDNGKNLELKFLQYHPMVGGHLKFCIIRDEVSKMFWATANFGVDTQETNEWYAAARKQGGFRQESTAGDDRRFLMLLYGVDGMNWFQAGCVAQAKKLSQSFMYGALVVDGDDLAIISRTSINAPHQHDADHATFHRVRDFRRLALNLYPDPE